MGATGKLLYYTFFIKTCWDPDLERGWENRKRALGAHPPTLRESGAAGRSAADTKAREAPGGTRYSRKCRPACGSPPRRPWRPARPLGARCRGHPSRPRSPGSRRRLRSRRQAAGPAAAAPACTPWRGRGRAAAEAAGSGGRRAPPRASSAARSASGPPGAGPCTRKCAEGDGPGAVPWEGGGAGPRQAQPHRD